MEFLFSKELDQENLRQGDLLQRTTELKAAIGQAHDYYAKAEDYSHFIVLTQSCDLVRRQGKRCKSRYITLAAVRPLDLLIEREVARFKHNNVELPSYQVCQKDRETYARQLLERLLHNTEDGYFFIRKNSVQTVTHDLCAFLPLSIALRADHYDACLSAKVAQLNHIFAAKLGWLTGNLYSRVATPDLEEELETDPVEYKRDFFDEVLLRKTAWLSPAQVKALKKNIDAWRKENPEQALDQGAAKGLLESVPEDVELIAGRAVALLQQGELLEKNEGLAEKAKKLLINDTNFRRLTQTKSVTD